MWRCPSRQCARQSLSPRSAGSARYLSSQPAKPRVIFSGIQPTGVPHLGNYLGALLPWVRLQKDNEARAAETGQPKDTLIYSLVDLHAITVRQNAAQLRQWKRESLATLLAIGLDADKSLIFHQSHVPAHAELMWILSCSASVGYLSRMTQWKSKMALPENAKALDSPLQLGLFAYPVLQAADVLMHRATHVPVGQDQSQHLEFTRTCASAFNHVYDSDLFPLPETLISPAKRIMSLTKPDKKMSKSDPNAESRISIIDSPQEVEAKVRAAVTDSEAGISYDSEKRPALANLIDLILHLQLQRKDGMIYHSPQDVIKDCVSKKALKDTLTAIINLHLEPIRASYEALIAPSNSDKLDQVALDGAQRANKSANATMEQVRTLVGLA